MPKVILSKADSLPDELFSATILIYGNLPDFPSLNHGRHWYKAEAERLGKVLYESLPGGTLDQLLLWLMEKKVSLLKVPFPRSE